jgi:hypothetical protein
MLEEENKNWMGIIRLINMHLPYHGVSNPHETTTTIS